MQQGSYRLAGINRLEIWEEKLESSTWIRQPGNLHKLGTSGNTNYCTGLLGVGWETSKNQETIWKDTAMCFLESRSLLNSGNGHSCYQLVSDNGPQQYCCASNAQKVHIFIQRSPLPPLRWRSRSWYQIHLIFLNGQQCISDVAELHPALHKKLWIKYNTNKIKSHFVGFLKVYNSFLVNIWILFSLFKLLPD